MILPVATGAQTGDACTFIPVPRDKSKIYEIINVAGTTFGDFKQGDQLDMQSVGQYAQMRRNYVLQTKGDGVKPLSSSKSPTLKTVKKSLFVRAVPSSTSITNQLMWMPLAVIPDRLFTALPTQMASRTY